MRVTRAGAARPARRDGAAMRATRGSGRGAAAWGRAQLSTQTAPRIHNPARSLDQCSGPAVP